MFFLPPSSSLHQDNGNESLEVVNLKGVTGNRFFRPALGAGLTLLCGLALWQMPLGERWVNLAATTTYSVSVQDSHEQGGTHLDGQCGAYCPASGERGRWDRALHAKLLKQLAADGCRLVVFRCTFRITR
jgi:hypothetical protein